LLSLDEGTVGLASTVPVVRSGWDVLTFSLAILVPRPKPARNMKAKVKLIKKADRNGPVPPVEAVAGVDQKEWSTAVKGWVSEFQDRQDEALVPFDSLFDDSKL
jgi:hypothetical protein